jgi:hypothetical protein
LRPGSPPIKRLHPTTAAPREGWFGTAGRARRG